MKKIINSDNKEYWVDTELSSKIKFGMFCQVETLSDDIQYALHTDIGSITIFERITGFGWLDVETGFRDTNGKFWLDSGNKNVMDSKCDTFGEAVEWIKNNANTCVGV